MKIKLKTDTDHNHILAAIYEAIIARKINEISNTVQKIYSNLKLPRLVCSILNTNSTVNSSQLCHYKFSWWLTRGILFNCICTTCYQTNNCHSSPNYKFKTDSYFKINTWTRQKRIFFQICGLCIMHHASSSGARSLRETHLRQKQESAEEADGIAFFSSQSQFLECLNEGALQHWQSYGTRYLNRLISYLHE